MEEQIQLLSLIQVGQVTCQKDSGTEISKETRNDDKRLLLFEFLLFRVVLKNPRRVFVCRIAQNSEDNIQLGLVSFDQRSHLHPHFFLPLFIPFSFVLPHLRVQIFCDRTDVPSHVLHYFRF